jgi:teichuronic acid biosynthesis glycosyltransferase TuaH
MTPEQDTGAPGLSLSVTIVNHSARDLLRTCLGSLRAHPYTRGPIEIVVLDNASEDGSIEMLRDEYPEVTVLAERVRRGYGANQNLAIRASHGDVVLMLNPDAAVHEHTMDRLVDALRSEERVTIAGGPIANDDGSLRQDRPHRFPKLLSPLRSTLGLERLSSLGPMEHTVTDDGWPSGAACLVMRSAFEEAGGFDESYFMYSEDTDLFMRLIETGHLVAWVPEAIVTHPFRDEPADFAARREAEIVKGELQYMSKHSRGTAVFRAGVAIDSVIKLTIVSIPGLSRLIRQHGKTRAYIKRVLRARLAAAVRPDHGPGLGDLANDWNRRNAADTGAAATSQTMDNLIVFDSSTTWDGPWMAFQHIAIHLAKRGPVLFIDGPESPVYSYREYGKPRFRSQLTRLSENLYRLTPVAPPGLTRPGIHRLTEVMVRRAVASAIRKLNANVHAFLCSLSSANLFDVADANVRVYYASDDFQAGAELMGRPASRIRQLDEELARDADAIVAISPAIADSYRSRGFDPILVPNGVEVDAFAAVDEAPIPDDVTLDGPVAGYIGHISDRIDLSLIEAVVDSGISVLMVGPRQQTFGHDSRLSDILARPNVQWVGPKAFDELPSYLRLMDVGLLPYTNSEFNRASFPLKTLEYLAAGRPVVATALPAVTWLETTLIATADEPREFAELTLSEAEKPRTAAVVDERRAFAAKHSWAKRTGELAEILKIE